MAQTLPESLRRAGDLLGRSPAGTALVRALHSLAARAESAEVLSRVASGTLNAVTTTILIPFLGLFLAIDPRLYTHGLAELIPPRARPDLERALEAVGHALSHWLLGVLASMLCIGVATGLGLWALDIPLALSLGIVAGLLEFVPFIGPILSAVPAVLVAFSLSPFAVLEVVGLYIVVQHLESYALVPLLQKRAVALPPALTLIAFVIFGLIFGVLGIIFATPLMVAARALIEELYVKRIDACG